MQLNQLIDRIDSVLGEELPFTEETLLEGEKNTLNRVFGERGYQRYLQDQISRQVIRDYLANAVVLGHLAEQELTAYSPLLASSESREELALQMVVASVDQARELCSLDEGGRLIPLAGQHGESTHIRLVKS